MMFILHHLDERLVQYLITEETLDVQHVLLLLCLVFKHQIHCIQVYLVPNVLQEYFEINTYFNRLPACFLRRIYLFLVKVCLCAATKPV